MQVFLCKLSKSEILRLYSIIHVAIETTKMSNFTCQSKFFIKIFSTCQVSACELQPFSCHNLANDLHSETAKTVFSHLNRAYSISFNSSSDGEFFWSWIAKDCTCIKFQEKKKEGRCRVFTFPTIGEIRQCLVVVVQRRQRNVQKSVMHVQSCCFTNLNLLLFCRSRCVTVAPYKWHYCFF